MRCPKGGEHWTQPGSDLSSSGGTGDGRRDERCGPSWQPRRDSDERESVGTTQCAMCLLPAPASLAPTSCWICMYQAYCWREASIDAYRSFQSFQWSTSSRPVSPEAQRQNPGADQIKSSKRKTTRSKTRVSLTMGLSFLSTFKQKLLSLL